MFIAVAGALVVPIILTAPLIGLEQGTQTSVLGSLFNSYDSQIVTAEAAVLPMDVKETFTTLERTGDGKSRPSQFTIESEVIDPDNHCEFCYRIEFKPGATGKAGAIMKASKVYNLENAERMIVFARGEDGGEEVSFSAGGKMVEKRSGLAAQKELRFSFTSEKMKLDKDWRKYEIDLAQVDLKSITHGFGFEVAKSKTSDKPIVIYLKGMTYDTDAATESLRAANSTSTS
jgi:hypothetical protein